MRLKDFKLLAITLLLSSYALAQHTISGTVTHSDTGEGIADVQIYNKAKGQLTETNADGSYTFQTDRPQLQLVFFSYDFQVEERLVSVDNDVQINISLKPLGVTLSEVEISARKEKVFELSRLKDVEGTSIFAGKKTEVVLVEQSMANLASNNARQIFSQVVGLNIYQNDDAGLQLNIGGRGLDPNRTANFNTRQNGYDISADVLGYPESYYTPASEGIKEIQVVRGAASLQYGTQFGGLINFKMKTPNPNKPFELITRNTVGSNGLYTNFTSVSGTKKKWSYYSYFNYKKGDGFRPHSEFESKNVFAHLGYQFNENTSLTGEVTYMRYLAQQGGGLSDTMFYTNPNQSNRERNWFQVDWLLYNLKFAHQFTENTNFTFNFFGLNASRYALGYRSNRVDQADPLNERDLIKGDFKNYGFETRLLSKYKVLDKDATFLIGAKVYNADNKQQQGAGSDGYGADFSFYNNAFSSYKNQSQFDLPNFNVSVFGENIFYLNDKVSITPGVRFEYIRTQSNGVYKNINLDGADNVIFEETITDNQDFERSFILFGVGLSYKPSSALELYANWSQNYRSVTFSDINISNPAFQISPDITDEDGFTADLGIRGALNTIVSYDIGAFALFYNGRIGFIQKKLDDNRVVSERGNVGDARTFGLESLVDFNLKKILQLNSNFSFNYFVNASFINSEYTASKVSGVKGNKVEFVPDYNIKTGMKFGYKNLLANVQYSYLSEQFTDATNSKAAGISGVIGEIPTYDILDVSLSYSYKRFKLETGINNVLDNAYFTRRATGYPGPGIIPSSPRNYYATLQVKF
ncbi:TonB-dependent receptor plug domain-containing protein [Bizionia gelidisalsuginis]|uniref:TonB-dependent receptor plug domain-containing protein n=2 Tax=Bizionia TaxID=283785 RepID=A0A8H2LHB9_9FLAO|nr:MULTISPECIES: TonB-dependent receptor [Bizionia]TYB80113.1 TonB-dependent receptor plug domain-containing protein [Bizionia saleffrena]TYC09722.1 TonB-dependent receptor plug domain-containing protein [Bizionia gelidisalsuginis]